MEHKFMPQYQKKTTKNQATEFHKNSGILS